jgi:hypothetical protein
MLYTPVYAGQNTCCDDAKLPASEDTFATEPAVVAQSVYQRLDEEALHALFEQAISDRLGAVAERLRLCSGQLSNRPSEAIAQQDVAVPGIPLRRGTYGLWPNQIWQRRVIFASLVCMLVMAGFDLMGILILRLH